MYNDGAAARTTGIYVARCMCYKLWHIQLLRVRTLTRAQHPAAVVALALFGRISWDACIHHSSMCVC